MEKKNVINHSRLNTNLHMDFKSAPDRTVGILRAGKRHHAVRMGCRRIFEVLRAPCE